MKKMKVVLIALGMLSCVLLSAFLFPGGTPLRAFLAVSSEVLLVGNYILVKTIEDAKKDAASENKWSWPRTLKIWIVLDGAWVVSELLHKSQ